MNLSFNHGLVIILILSYIFYLNYLGIFGKYSYITDAKATTGPDFWIVYGKYKLKNQIGFKNFDKNGIMVEESQSNEIFSCINDENALEYDYFYIITGKVISYKLADGSDLCPVIDVKNFKLISKIKFWFFHILFVSLILISLIIVNLEKKKRSIQIFNKRIL